MFAPRQLSGSRRLRRPRRPPTRRLHTPSTASCDDGPDSAAGSSRFQPPAPTRTKLPNSDVPPRRSKCSSHSFSISTGRTPSCSRSHPSRTSPRRRLRRARPGRSRRPPRPHRRPAPPSPPPCSPPVRSHQGGAVIEVNGTGRDCRGRATRSRTEPAFRLVALPNGVALIGIANGAYSSGAQTVSLQSSTTLTLVDTSDGIRYEIGSLSTS